MKIRVLTDGRLEPAAITQAGKGGRIIRTHRLQRSQMKQKILLLLLIAALPLAAVEYEFRDLLFLPWGDRPGDVARWEVPATVLGPSAFSVEGNRIAVLDRVNEALKFYQDSLFDYAQHIPLTNAEDFLLHDNSVYLLQDNVIYTLTHGNIEDKMTVSNPRHRITDMRWDPIEKRVLPIINYSTWLNPDINAKGRYMLFKGIPVDGNGSTVRVTRKSFQECELQFPDGSEEILPFERLAVSRFVGLSPDGQLFVYVEEYSENDPQRVKRSVLLVDEAQGVQARFHIPRLAWSEIIREFYVDGAGNLYKMISAEDGIHITAWLRQNSETADSLDYYYPEKFNRDFHYSDPPVPEVLPDSLGLQDSLRQPDSLYFENGDSLGTGRETQNEPPF